MWLVQFLLFKSYLKNNMVNWFLLIKLPNYLQFFTYSDDFHLRACMSAASSPFSLLCSDKASFTFRTQLGYRFLQQDFSILPILVIITPQCIHLCISSLTLAFILLQSDLSCICVHPPLHPSCLQGKASLLCCSILVLDMVPQCIYPSADSD